MGNRYVWQGGQTENQGGQTEKIFSALCAEFCPPWPETLPAPLGYVSSTRALFNIQHRFVASEASVPAVDNDDVRKAVEAAAAGLSHYTAR